jgi:hypothetical protein
MAASRAFDETIRKLWARLNLAQPAFAADDSIILQVDGLAIVFRESADGRHVVVEGTAGVLAGDPHGAAEQVQRLLKANLGFMLDNEAGLYLHQVPGGTEVRAQALHAYVPGDLEALTKRVEDVIQLLEYHGAELTGAAGRPRPAARPRDDLSYETFIIRP